MSAPKSKNPVFKALRPVWKLVTSLKFAVLVMILITLGMIVATVLESMYDTPTSQYFVYRHNWFLGILILFGVNILSVALSRLPWQKKHIPFLLAHLGILVLLYGSWLTFQFGVDGNMSVSEGTDESVVELNEPQLLVADEAQVKAFTVGWRPPFIDFKPMDISEYGLKVTRFITHADGDLRFIPDETPGSPPAVHVKLFGGPKSPPFMRRGQDLWLWAGDANWSAKQIGPAALQIVQTENAPFPDLRPVLQIRYDSKKKALLWHSKGSDQSERKGEIKEFTGVSEENPITIDPGWKNDAKISFFSIIPNAKVKLSYVESNLQFGQGAPESAVYVEPLENTPIKPGETRAISTEGVWLGLGDKVFFDVNGKRLQLGYFPKRLVLPFAVRLNRFQIDHYQGTMNPMSFSSNVSVRVPAGAPPAESGETWIRMNEPLKHGGYTFYQASYVPANPRPTISVFSVNQDPGRWVKYLGALLLVIGSILFFFQKLKNQRPKAKEVSA